MKMSKQFVEMHLFRAGFGEELDTFTCLDVRIQRNDGTYRTVRAVY